MIGPLIGPLIRPRSDRDPTVIRPLGPNIPLCFGLFAEACPCAVGTLASAKSKYMHLCARACIGDGEQMEGQDRKRQDKIGQDMTAQGRTGWLGEIRKGWIRTGPGQSRAGQGTREMSVEDGQR